MHKVLLTGATGFLGAYVARLLVHKGYAIIATKRPSSRMDLVEDFQDKIEWVNCELADYIGLEELSKRVTAIVHCAAMVSFQSKAKKKMHEVNVQGTHDLVNLALEHNIKRFVHISSIAAIGRSKNQNYLNEESAWVDHPDNSGYAITKYLSEQEVWRAHAEGLNTAILNPSLIIGAGYFDSGSPAIIARQAQGNPFYPNGATGFVDVRDVAKFTVKALESNQNGERYIISGGNISFKAFLEKLSKEIGCKKPTLRLNSFWIHLLSKLDWLKSVILRSERLVSKENLILANKSSQYDNSKSLGLCSAGYISLASTITDMVKVYKMSEKKGKNHGLMVRHN